MERNVTPPLPLRLLLNAEPFGFGPTAAIAGFFPHLRPHFQTVGYMGKSHTLDLQKTLPYDAIHDISETSNDQREENDSIFAQYDIVLTAMDHKIAGNARKAGLKVFYYDALTWYWPELPQSAQKSDLYMAQDFFGVRERLTDIFTRHAAAYIVPPIAPKPVLPGKKNLVLINLGGLQNPAWPIDNVVDYARVVITALRQAIPLYEKIVIAGSQAVAERLKDEGVQTYPRRAMEDILARSKVAFMTPGLGNIYDAGAYNLPAVWLPPANDSQGRQLYLLKENGMSDAAIDWSTIMPNAAISYKDDQSTVLACIATMATRLAAEPGLQKSLTRQAAAHYQAVSKRTVSNTSKIIDRFGTGGEEKVAALVISQAQDYGHG